MERIDAAVVGAGVVGLAIARALAVRGRSVVILEQADRFGSEISARNSEVIHAGLYYPDASLKASLCVEGCARLYRYCADRGVPHRRLGKLVVAAETGAVDRLAALSAQGMRNGVADLAMLEGPQVRRLEPAVRCVAGLWSPSTGIIDSHALMLSLLGDAEDAGAALAVRSRVDSIEPGPDGLVLRIGAADRPDRGEASMTLAAGVVVNAAGLGAPALAAATGGLPPGAVPRLQLAKGHYFALRSGRAPFSRLIYPLPEPGGLGIHLTLDLAGQARFGPDVAWVDRCEYGVPADLAPRFVAAIRTYWPGLPDDGLVPAYAGIRPKLTGPGEPGVDFRIDGPAHHGVAGLVNLFGIESPGLTAALALADRVVGLLEETVG